MFALERRPRVFPITIQFGKNDIFSMKRGGSYIITTGGGHWLVHVTPVLTRTRGSWWTITSYPDRTGTLSKNIGNVFFALEQVVI